MLEPTRRTMDLGLDTWLFLKMHCLLSFEDRIFKARPHIESRIKTLKDFTTVYDMRFGPTSGFGWNDKTHIVTAPSHVWDAYLKVHEKAAKWRYNRFLWFDNLSILFGNCPNCS